MTQLIVALDGPEPWHLADTLRGAGARWFKIGPQAMVSGGWDRLVDLGRDGARLFLDLKLADTEDTCREAVARFAGAGIAAVSTVRATATIAALRAAEGTPLKVWEVHSLTDQIQSNQPRSMIAHGIICPVIVALAMFRNATTICPGIRFPRDADNGHLATGTPDTARIAGVSFAVVGRPIWQADDPVSVMRKFMAALGEG